jgi:MFS family permease
MVHVYELAFPSVEQLIAAEYGVGKAVMGDLGNCWRLPFGFGAILVGWLVDRWGAKRPLVVYLCGCAATAALTWRAPSLDVVFATMFAMGSFASIYHPAGLALISHETRPEQRPLALGIHGILGSAGIAAGPIVAGISLTWLNWRQYYLCLAIPGGLLAAVVAALLVEHHRQPTSLPDQPTAAGFDPAATSSERAQWRAFFILTISGICSGFVYAALMNFLPRYLDRLSIRPEAISPQSLRNYAAGAVLLVGIAGQFAAGWVGKSGRLERQLCVILLALVPLLVAMALAHGDARLWAASAVSFVLFMQQPIYNSLIAQYIPRRRRSLGFGISNTLGFGLGSFGAKFAGHVHDDRLSYGSLAVMSLASALVAAVLWWRNSTTERQAAAGT